jgi:hypothetical protein
LRALIVGLFAIVLVTQATAAAFGGNPSSASHTSAPRASATGSKPAPRAKTLDEQLQQKLAAARKYRGTIHFFETHRELLSASKQRVTAFATLRQARQRLARVKPSIARLRAAIARRDARRLAAMPPRRAICEVFGEHCEAAISVAWCESRLSTTAENGQYRGLFQMGESERRIFGHGPTAHEQALAAHRYFVRSGRDWSPWSCRWAAS